MLNRRDWLLLFIGLPGGRYMTDQIRVMKGMFLFSMEGPRAARELYGFQPYDYGPFDTQIYHDLDTLEARGLIRSEVVEGTNRRIYSLTTKGEQSMAALLESAEPHTANALRRIKRHVTSLGFIDLLREVYERYPDYAVRSVARL